MTARKLGKSRTLAIGAVVAAIGAIVLASLLAYDAGPSSAGAADHLDAPGLTPPPGGDGIGTDLTDIYAFRSPADAGKTVLVMNVNGLTTGDLANPPGPDRAFGSMVPKVHGNPHVSYNFRIDSNGDASPDVTIQVRFIGNAKRDGAQKMLVSFLGAGKHINFVGRSTSFGQQALVNTGPGGIKAFAGRRDDPFFFDLVGFLNVLDIGGRSLVGCGSPSSHPERDTFKGQNVSSIVLEVPSALLEGGGDSNIGVWATTNVGDTQIDRMGRPAINTVFIPNNPFPPDRAEDGKASKKTTFNHGEPSNDVANWRAEVVDTLQTTFSLNNAGGPLGGTDNPSDDAAKISGLAGFLLPDILTVNVSSPAGFPNGRKPADDVIDAELGLVTEGFVTTDCVGSNDKAFPTTFPYLAVPHPTHS
jgi:Domain of unknown function (DUF4331)